MSDTVNIEPTPKKKYKYSYPRSQFPRGKSDRAYYATPKGKAALQRYKEKYTGVSILKVVKERFVGLKPDEITQTDFFNLLLTVYEEKMEGQKDSLPEVLEIIE